MRSSLPSLLRYFSVKSNDRIPKTPNVFLPYHAAQPERGLHSLIVAMLRYRGLFFFLGLLRRHSRDVRFEISP